MSMSETKCFICNSRSARNLTSPRTSNILADQLSAIFLLRNVFELPSWTTQKYLISGQNPSEWLSVCTECDHYVRKTRTFYEQLLEADRTFKRAKYELVQKLKESLPPVFSNCGSISEECRQFVQLHDYAEPPKNPFGDDDRGVGVDFDVANLNVKMEIFESTEDTQLELDPLNVTFDHQHPTYMTFDCSPEDLPFTPEGHDYGYDNSEDGGSGYHDDGEDDYDEDYACLPPGPKCRKIEAATKYETSSSNTKTKTDLEPRRDEISAAEASNLVQFLTTFRGKRMVRYDGHNYYFYHRCQNTTSSGLTHFRCKWRRQGCQAKISLRNYNEEDATYTGFRPNLVAHDHSAVRIGSDKTKHAALYEVNSLAKEIVKDNVNLPTMQVVQMVKDSFIGEPEVTEELKKKNAHRNLSTAIRSMKQKMGWKPDPNVRAKGIKTGRRQGAEKVNPNPEDHAPILPFVGHTVE